MTSQSSILPTDSAEDPDIAGPSVRLSAVRATPLAHGVIAGHPTVIALVSRRNRAASSFGCHPPGGTPAPAGVRPGGDAPSAPQLLLRSSPRRLERRTTSAGGPSPAVGVLEIDARRARRVADAGKSASTRSVREPAGAHPTAPAGLVDQFAGDGGRFPNPAPRFDQVLVAGGQGPERCRSPRGRGTLIEARRSRSRREPSGPQENKMTPDANTSISAVAVLEPTNSGPRLVVYHNRYAIVPIEPATPRRSTHGRPK